MQPEGITVPVPQDMNSSELLIENEHEALATLQDALAFIDAFETDTFASVRTETTPGESTKTQKKKRSHTERVKCELEKLRSDAEVLEATLKRLKGQPSDTTTVRWTPLLADTQSTRHTRAGVSKWTEIVMEEYRRRRESEALNRRLKVMLSKQSSMVQASKAALSFQFTDTDLNALYGPELSSDVHQENALAISLSCRVRQLQLDLDTVLNRTGLIHTDSYLSWAQRKRDETFGVYFESTLCLPIPFSFEQTTKAFASEIGKSEREPEMKNLSQYQEEATVEHQEQTFDLNIKASLRTLTEGDSVICVWSAQAWLPSKQWTFLEDSIIVVRRANASVSSSLLQNWHRVWMEEEASVSSVLSDPLKESILDSLSQRGRDHLRAFKSSMETKKRRKDSC